jgi:hypothetical protein
MACYYYTSEHGKLQCGEKGKKDYWIAKTMGAGKEVTKEHSI